MKASFSNASGKNSMWDVKEAVPPNIPGPLGNEADLRLFVDSSHANDKVAQ